MPHTIRAIDIHSHINHGSRFDSRPGSRINKIMLDDMWEMYRAANIETMFCSTYASVITAEETAEENRYLTEIARREKNLYQWVVSSVLAWRITGTGEPGGLPSLGLHRVGHD